MKTSNELGLHLARLERERKPFDVLKNLKESFNNPFTKFNAKREVQVYPSNELIALALGKNNNCLV